MISADVRTAVVSVVRGVLGMEITHQPRSRLRAIATQFLLGIAGLALITFVCFQVGFGLARTGFAYVILVALVSLLGSFSTSVVLSLVAAVCLTYFFAPPLFELRVDSADDIVRIAAFLTTSLLVTALITKRKRAEEDLGNSNVRLEAAQRIAHVGWWERDVITGRVTVSDEVCRILGVRPVAQWLNLIHPEDRPRAADAAAAAIRPGGPRYDVEYKVVRPDGTLRVVHSQGDVIWDDSGRPLRKFGVLQDITELRQTEQELRASEARFRTFVDHATDAFFLLDDDSTVLDVNRCACDTLGYSREELIGKHRSDFDVGLDDTSIQRLKQRIVAGEAITFETRHRRKDGTTFPVEIRVGQFEQGGRRFLCLARDISERKLTEASLRQRERELREILETIPAMTVTVLPDGSNVFIGKRFSEYSGLSEEDGQGSGWKACVHPDDLDLHVRKWRASLTSGDPIEVETRFRRADREYRWFLARAAPLRDEVGNILKWYEVLTDIEDRKRAEERSRESQARLEAAQRIAHVGWWERDFTTGHVSLSDEVCRIFGVQPLELPQWHERWLKLIHRDDRPRAAGAATAALLPGGPRYDVEYRVVRPDGSEPIVHSQGDVTWDEAGKPLRQFGVLQDITELRRAEEELRESEERFRTLVQFSFDVYWESDAQHRFSRQGFADGLADAPPPGSELGKTRWEVPYVEPDEEAWRKHRETLDAHLPFRDFELARPTPDGGKRYVSVSGLPVFDRSGRFIGYRGVGRHITERKRAEEALRRSEAYLAEAQRLSHTGTLAFNATAPVYWSEESYLIWGLDPRQGLPERETVLQRIHPDDRERVNVETEQALREKRDFTLEFRIVLPDGTVKHIESTGRPLFSADGELLEMVATHVEVTERKRAQEEHERLRQLEADLAHMNRLSIMGELTASLAHEILHPIATARNNARAAMRFLDMSPPNMAEVREALACIVRDADRGKDIVDRIRAHIKKAPPRHDRFDINEAIEEVIEMVRAPIEKNRVSVRTRLAAGLTSVWGDRVQLQQVVLNLILNAIEAMGSIEERGRMLSIRTEQRGATGILVAVHDSGPGVAPEHFQRVFEPFYTTKNSGLGMGLSICRSIIDAHGGRLWADADQRRGTVFQFTLPAAQENS
jgi:PAS domain S-box-containing protein